MKLKYRILLLLILATCLEITKCMVIHNALTNVSTKLEESHLKKIEMNPTEIEFTSQIPVIIGQSDNELLQHVQKSNATKIKSIILNENKTEHKQENKSAIIKNHLMDAAGLSIFIKNITDDIIKSKNNILKQYSNQYQNEGIVQLPPTINYEQQVKDIMEEKGSLNDIPYLEIRKRIMTELLDVDHPQNIRPDHSSNTFEKVKEMVLEEAQTTKSIDENSLAESTETPSFTDKIINILNIDDKYKSETNSVKEQLIFQNMETTNGSGKLDFNEDITTESNLKNMKSKLETEDKGDDLYFADFIEPSKTQESVFYLKVDLNTPFQILDRDRLVKWMDRQSTLMKINFTEKNKIEIDEANVNTKNIRTDETKFIKIFEGVNLLKLFGNASTEMLTSNLELSKNRDSNSQSSEDYSNFFENVTSPPDLSTPVAYIGPSEVEILESSITSENTQISKPLLVINSEERINLLNKNSSANIISENESEHENNSHGVILGLTNYIKIIDNLNLDESPFRTEKALSEIRENFETTTSIPDFSRPTQELIQENKQNQAQTFETIIKYLYDKNRSESNKDQLNKINDSSEENSSESKEHQLNKKKDSSEENSSESSEHRLDIRTKNLNKDSSEPNSSKHKTKIHIENTSIVNKIESETKLVLKENTSIVNKIESETKLVLEESSGDDNNIESSSKNNKIEKTKNSELNNDENHKKNTETSTDIAEATTIIAIRINSDNSSDEYKKENETRIACTESKKSTETLIPKEHSDEINYSQLRSEFSRGLQPNSNLKVFLTYFSEKQEKSLTFETTTLLQLKQIQNKEEIQTLNSGTENRYQINEIADDSDILHEIVNSDDAIASASIGRSSLNLEIDNKSIISYLLSSAVVVMIIGILMGTFYKYRGKQGTLNIELEERKSGKNNDILNEELEEISISTPVTSDNSACQ